MGTTNVKDAFEVAANKTTVIATERANNNQSPQPSNGPAKVIDLNMTVPINSE
jgi:hypothetical protein